MFDISLIDQHYDVYSSLMAEVINIEVDAMNNGEEVESIEVKIISLNLASVTNDAVLDKLLMEFILYETQLDEIIPEHKELFIDYIGTNGVYHDLVGYYDKLPDISKRIENILKVHGNYLMFIGWARNGSIIESRDAGFMIGFKDG